MALELDAALAEARKKDAAGDLRAAVALLDSVPAPQRTGMWHYARGSIASRTGELPAAVELLGKAVELEPELAEYRGNLGAVLLEQARAGDTAAGQRALSELERAVYWGPKLPHVHSNLGVARLIAGDAAGALKALDQALALEPRHVPSLYNRAAALKALGRLEDCLAALDATLLIEPGFTPAMTSRKSTLQQLGRP